MVWFGVIVLMSIISICEQVTISVFWHIFLLTFCLKVSLLYNIKIKKVLLGSLVREFCNFTNFCFPWLVKVTEFHNRLLGVEFWIMKINALKMHSTQFKHWLSKHWVLYITSQKESFKSHVVQITLMTNRTYVLRMDWF